MRPFVAGAIETALNQYDLERKPVVETFQRAANESQLYFETIKRYLKLDPMQFTFQLLTPSGRISYDDLRLRDARFGDAFDRWYVVGTSLSASVVAITSKEAVMLRKLCLLLERYKSMDVI
jgi:anthraniloyl-CoA monooxygenase